ncbi:MAG TPA: sialidase family protein [Polyangiaceae bacterium]|nr:sialidase family protein [Polyangiaceae bacterium]
MRPSFFLPFAFVLAGTLSCSASSGVPGPGAGASLTAQGCRTATPAVAYSAQATGSVAATGTGSAPFPCFSLTGYGTSESSLGIASDGAVYMAPAYTADGNGVAVSKDEGASWQTLIPKFPQGGGHGRVQPFFYLDPATGRMFLATSHTGGGFDMSWSADGGGTWNYETISTDTQDWIKFLSGPVPAGGSAPSGYASVLYTSAPSPISTPSGGILPGPDHQAIYRSLDGGATWTSVGGSDLTLDPSKEVTAGLASAATCPSSEWVIFGDGVVGADGTIYLGYRMCTQLAIAISKDEGATWSSVVVPGSVLPSFTSIASPLTTQNLLASEPVTVDSSGNLYAIWNDAAGLVRMAVSKDQGATWSDGATGASGSAAIVVSAPGVTTTVLSAITVKSPGTVAIAYFGSTDGAQFDGYLAESTNALDPSPTFWSATVNSPSEPLFASGFDNDYAGSLSGGDLDELVQVKYAPSGDIWASYLKEMCPKLNTKACSWDYAAHANSVFQGAIGRLVHTK